MKNRIFRYLMILAGTAVAVASCERMELQEKPEYVTSIEVSIEQPDFSEFEADTKASYSLDANNRPVASWSEDDIIGIYPVGGDQVAFNLSGNITDGKAVFDGGSWSLKTEYQYAAYCPFNEDYYHRKESSLPVSYNGQKQTGDNSVDHLGAFAYMASAASSPNERGEVSIALKSIGCIVQLKVKLPEGMPVAKLTLTDKTEDLVVGGKMDLTQTDVTAMKSPVYSESISIDCDNLTAGTDPVKVWIMLPPQDLRGHELELTASTQDGGSERATMASCTKNLTANGAYVLDFADASTDYTPDYLCFTAEAEGSTISMRGFYLSHYQPVPELEYSFDGESWQEFDIVNTVVTLQKVGDKVYFRGNNETFNYSEVELVYFVMAGKIAASGNIMTLLDPEGRKTSVPDRAFLHLFSKCNILVSAPEFPATELADFCYYGMFSGCTNLTAAPDLPAATLADNCYQYMFSDCTRLTSVPELPATKLEPSCYYGMFQGCSSLEKAPVLPATTLADNCCQYMFLDCTRLASAPDLPATKLEPSCYYGMFQGCSSLEKAPVLPATTLADQCYYEMFNNCSKLNRIEAYFTDWNEAGESTTDWVDGVASTGTFVCPPDLLIENGESRIPEGWTVVQDGGDSEESEETPDYFYLSAEMPNTTVSMAVTGSGWNLPVLEYSTDRRNWKKFTPGETTVTLPHITGKVWFRGDNRYFSNSDSEYITIETNSGGRISAGGNIMSLLDKTCQSKTITDSYTFRLLFNRCEGLVSVSDLQLPATTLSDYCYAGMFNGCSNLPAAPKLPATSLTEGCYSAMFRECSSLTKAPELPATTLAAICYNNMFCDCTGLTEAPYLPATQLADYCYQRMFYGCSSLKAVNVEFTDWTGHQYPTYDWLSGVAERGDFNCPAALTDNRGTDYIPTKWNKVAPDDKYLTFIPETNETHQVSFVIEGNPSIRLEYKTDDMASWQSYTNGTTITFQYPNHLHFRGDNASFSTNSTNYGHFIVDGEMEVCGNIMTLLDKSGKSTTIPTQYCFYRLFEENEDLIDAGRLELPASILKQWCYAFMFSNCQYMESGPVIPDATAAEHSYDSIFFECQSLVSNGQGTDGVTINLTGTLPEGCLDNAFYDCYYLTKITVKFNSCGYPVTTDWLSGTGEYADEEGETLEFWCNQTFYDNLQRLGAERDRSDNVPNIWDVKRL